MEQRLKKVLMDLFNIKDDEVDNASMKTIRSWDSLKHMELVVSIEEEFKMPQFSSDDIVKMTSYAQIKDVLKSKNIDI